MDVLMIVLVIAIVIYPKRNTFVDRFKFKVGLKGLEVDISTKEKNGSPSKNDRSSLK